MKNPKKNRWLLRTVALLGVILILVEAYVIFPPLRNGVVLVLERTGADESLVTMLSDADHDVRDSAVDALIRRGPKAVPALMRGIEHSDLQRRMFCLTTLQRIGPPAREVFETLREYARHHPDPEVRRASITAMAAVADYDPEAVSELLAILDSGDEGGRLAVFHALVASSKTKTPEVASAVARRLKDSSAKVREEAAELLGALAPVSAPAVPALIESLRDPQIEVRSEAAEALGRLAAFARPAVPGLIAALQDPDPRMRKEAAEAIEAIVKNWGDGEAGLRQQAMDALKLTRRQQ